ncbi:OpgC protein [Salipiger mucosus DSM 16094]|uniref:OpgC protein n=1 Tax=Salipiger mucosus DSM 16094 TaxID=1123237 RepID=S9QBE1_9RHOB|nr:OpgC protein [Salipiger mucosus DSM 16094]
MIFVLGLMVGVSHRRGERLVPVSRAGFALAAGFLILVLAWRHVPGMGAWMNHKMWVLGSWGVPDNLITHTKSYLGAPRLLHALALAYVLSCLPAVRRASAHRFAAPFRLLGRQGLAVFATGTILALACQILMDVEPDARWLGWVLPPIAVALSLLLAALLDGKRRRKEPHETAAPAAAAPRPGGVAAEA